MNNPKLKIDRWAYKKICGDVYPRELTDKEHKLLWELRKKIYAKEGIKFE